MKIRMLARAAGPEYSAREGDEIERPDAEAKALIKGGYAEPIAVGPEKTDATEDPLQKLVKQSANP